MRRQVVLLATTLSLAACGSPYAGRTLGQQVRSWSQDTGFAASIDSLQADARRVVMVARLHDPGALRTDCDVLVNDALGANQNLPTPDAPLTAALSSAYAAAAAAGHDCVRGAGGDATALGRAPSELDVAASGYIKAQARIDALGAGPGIGR